MTETATAQPGPQDLRSIMERAICLVIRFGGFGLSRKANTGAITVDADKSMLALSKRLLKSEEYDKIRQLDRLIKSFLKDIALPSPMKSGTYLVPIPLVEKVEQRLQEWTNERRDRVEAFLAAYPDQKKAVREDLRDLYNSQDYPSVEDLRACYSLEWQYIDFGVPGRLKQISAQLFETEREKQAIKLEEAGEEIKQALRGAFADLVGKMAQSLEPSSDGKRRVLRSSTIENLNAFMAIFEMRNITDDRELSALVSQARELMAGKDREIIKDDEAVRQTIAESFAKMAGTLQTMVVVKGARAIELEDDEVAV